MNRFTYSVIASSIAFGMLACTPEESEVPTDSDVGNMEPDVSDTPDSSIDSGEECDRFCIWERYLEAAVPLTFSECFCQPQLRESYRVEQQDFDICARNETAASEFSITDVEEGCIEAMTDDMLEALEEYTACFTARLALVEPCLRSLEVGDLCSSCESYLGQSGEDPCTDIDLFDMVRACTDNRPGF